MSTELPEQSIGRESLRHALKELSASRADFERFFGGACDQLDSMSDELANRQREWCAQEAQAESDAARQAAADDESIGQLRQLFEEASGDRARLQDSQQAVHQQVERLAAVAAELAEVPSCSTDGDDIDSVAAEELQRVLDEIRQQHDQWRAEQEASHAQIAQLAGVTAELADTRRELTDVREEVLKRREELECAALAEVPSCSTDVDDTERRKLDEKVRQLEQHESELQRERSELESDLEQVRNRAAELTESLAEQKRIAADQQTQWTGELKRLRQLMEGMSLMLSQGGTETSPPPAKPDKRAEPAEEVNSGGEEDPVLDSVMAQFEMIQRGLARRRVGSS